MPKKTIKVLVAPLNWGLGHATRCIPIIDYLVHQPNTEILIASSGAALELLQKHYPTLTCLELPNYAIRYSSKKKYFALQMLWQIPTILKSINQEHAATEQIVKEHNVKVVISDNRYGCYTANAKSIFITHQLQIALPRLWQIVSPIVQKTNWKLINKFNACWVPDFKNPAKSLSGKLSQVPKQKQAKLHLQYIGNLSRFTSSRVEAESKCAFKNGVPKFLKSKLLIVVSGVEPQRSLLLKSIQQAIKNNHTAIQKNYPTISIVCGQPQQAKATIQQEMPNTYIITYLNAEQLNIAYLNADLIITRAGYSSIMDLMATQQKAIIIPTPGQTEQEYLAKRLHQQQHFISIEQQNVQQKLPQYLKIPPQQILQSRKFLLDKPTKPLYQQTIDNLLKQVQL